MFKLFIDTFKYGYNCKVKVKFKIKYRKILKKVQFAQRSKVYLDGT